MRISGAVASVTPLQAGTGVTALVWTWSQPDRGDSATDTGQAKASGAGSAHTGTQARWGGHGNGAGGAEW